jgi:hypothetical protein
MKTKTLIQTIQVSGQPYITFEIKLPSHVERITGITITNSVNDNILNKVGTVSLQSNESSDLFFQAEVFQNGNVFPDPNELVIQPFGANSEKAWITGKVPKAIMTNISGSTGSLMGWYKSVYNTYPYQVKIYVHYLISEPKATQSAEPKQAPKA